MKLRTPLIIIFLIAVFSIKIQAQEGITQLRITAGIDEGISKMQIEMNTSLLLTAMSVGIIDGSIPDTSGIDISKEAAQTLFSMWQSTSEMICPISTVERKCLHRLQGGYQVRDIPVSMLAAPEDDRDHNLVINYTKDGKIDDIFVAIENSRIDQILLNNISVEDFSRRMKILDFVEQFRTAYNIKDLNHIKKVFSNNALIITGKVIVEKPNSDQVLQNIGKEKIVYQTQTKQEYVTKLEGIFANNKYINIEFEDIEVITHPKYNEIYGVTLKQKWNTSNYSDVGYLFLMIDFKDDDNPLIHVRTWQPDKYNGKELAREERFHIGSFGKLNR
ncbi:MAG: nuclear transport factor 2 family protein [Prevotellaceae bacterium]|jgi:hypothetical protein|nr:nuclear transport factor 2 family protein [Prevotellaceae bacterium]